MSYLYFIITFQFNIVLSIKIVSIFVLFLLIGIISHTDRLKEVDCGLLYCFFWLVLYHILTAFKRLTVIFCTVLSKWNFTFYYL